MCINVNVYVCIYTHIYIYIYGTIYIYIYIYVCVYIYIFIYIYDYLFISVYLFISTYTDTSVCVCSSVTEALLRDGLRISGIRAHFREEGQGSRPLVATKAGSHGLGL